MFSDCAAKLRASFLATVCWLTFSQDKASAQSKMQPPSLSRIDLVTEGLSAATEITEKAVEKAKLPTAVFKVPGGALGVVSGYAGGIEQGQGNGRALARGVLSWGVGELAGAAVVAGLCGVTAGIGCVAVGVLGGLAASQYATLVYDQYWKPIEYKKLDPILGTLFGSPCIDYAKPGESSICSDGSYSPPQLPPSYGPLLGGQGPCWGRGAANC